MTEFYVATGVGAFPLDMLRYDVCVPADECDSEWMGRERVGSECEPLERAVVVRAMRGRMTPDRWASFGWALHSRPLSGGRGWATAASARRYGETVAGMNSWQR